MGELLYHNLRRIVGDIKADLPLQILGRRMTVHWGNDRARDITLTCCCILYGVSLGYGDVRAKKRITNITVEIITVCRGKVQLWYLAVGNVKTRLEERKHLVRQLPATWTTRKSFPWFVQLCVCVRRRWSWQQVLCLTVVNQCRVPEALLSPYLREYDS